MFEDHFLLKIFEKNDLAFLLTKFELIQNPAICDWNFVLVLATKYNLLGKSEQDFRG